MLVVHYYEGPQLSGELRQMAEAVRKTFADDRSRMEYYFRDELTFSVVERCDAIVSTNDKIVEAYKEAGVGLYESKGSEPETEKAPRKRRTKKEIEEDAAKAESEQVKEPEPDPITESVEVTDEPQTSTEGE